MPLVTIVVSAHDGTETESWKAEIDTLSPYVVERMEQAGGNVRLAAALAQIHTLDIFPPRED